VTIGEEWTNLETVPKTAAEESIGKVMWDFMKGWFDQECQQMTMEKNRKYQSMLQRKFTRAASGEYCNARKKEKRIHKKEKKYYCEKQLKWIQECDTKNHSRKFYKQVNRTRNGFQVKLLSCRSTDGDILSDKADNLYRWKKYFQNLYDMTEDKLYHLLMKLKKYH
jgi:hypothetical protein